MTRDFPQAPMLKAGACDSHSEAMDDDFGSPNVMLTAVRISTIALTLTR